MVRPSDRPLYPPRVSGWRPITRDLAPGPVLLRLNSVLYPNPAFFGQQAKHRFDAPDSSYGVCYLGTTLEVCFLEALLRGVRPKIGLPMYLTESELSAWYAATVTLVRPVRLADFTDSNLFRMGTDLRVTCGDDYALSRAWSRAVHSAGDDIDGILFTSRHNNGLFNVAFFERARSALAFDVWGTLGDRSTPSLWSETTRILDKYNVGIRIDP